MSEVEYVELFRKMMGDAPEFGTVKYTRHLHRVIDSMSGFPRPDDLKMGMIVKYIENYMKRWERMTGKKFDAENIYKIRIPIWIKEIYR